MVLEKYSEVSVTRPAVGVATKSNIRKIIMLLIFVMKTILGKGLRVSQANLSIIL